MSTRVSSLAAPIFVSVVALTCGIAFAQEDPPPDLISSLAGIPIPPTETGGIVVDKLAAQMLGKAWFWDVEIGSDGKACASCHYHAGADVRLNNQVNPGHDFTFQPRGSDKTKLTGPNERLDDPNDFPFLKFKADATFSDRKKDDIEYVTNDRFSSQGTFDGDFVSAKRSPSGRGDPVESRTELCNLDYNPFQELDENGKPIGDPFHDRGWMFRRVEPRQTPSNINAVFFYNQFWDGRANNRFNGQSIWGDRDENAFVVVSEDGTSVKTERLRLKNMSLASQAVGPPLSDFEMSCAGRTWADIGRKINNQIALFGQKVHKNDSLFSKRRGLINPEGGLNINYRALIQKAFHPKYWEAEGNYVLKPNGEIEQDLNGFTMMELNTAMFFGIALHEYQALLISDQSPFDKFAGKCGNTPLKDCTEPVDGFGDSEMKGMDVFLNEGKCVNCHKGPVFTGIAITGNARPTLQNEQLVENMPMSNSNDGQFVALYDNAFYNIGVTPTAEDIGRGSNDAFGKELSYTQQFIDWWQNKTTKPVDPGVDDVIKVIQDGGNPFEVPLDPNNLNPRKAVDGAFKTPTTRNTGLNPPYFHNGGTATLDQLIEFYDRGGNRFNVGDCDSTGLRPDGSPASDSRDCSNLDPDIEFLDLKDKKENLKKFLLSQTDERVRCHAGPFDHPELPLPNGQLEPTNPGPEERAEDNIILLRAVGKDGYDPESCFPNTGNLFDVANHLETKFGVEPSSVEPSSGGVKDPPAGGGRP